MMRSLRAIGLRGCLAVALCDGAGAVKNAGRNLVLLPPIGRASALSGTSCFTASMAESIHRHASIRYSVNSGGVTSPGCNQGTPGSFLEGWAQGLVKSKNPLSLDMAIKL